MQKKFLLLALVAMLSACSTSPPLTPNEVANLEARAQKYNHSWYALISFSQLDFAKKPAPLASAQDLIDKYVKGFYIALNSNSQAQVQEGKLLAPHFEEFVLTQQSCSRALESKQVLAPALQMFCQKTVFYYQLMVESFSPEQVASLNLWALRRSSPQVWQLGQKNQLGFNYALPQASELKSTRFAPYILEHE
ncbi:hypothetical protein CJP74_00215 [Psittacicella melopsittaci]|uniref:Uncharacterized protein n=1 Tax=Psittacicella melopsittaci TaxID=2028576 RepID=A0A3A1Y917_9GAMM|nr:hypothetical protein [Psittacicella melopsittaci]RIY34041.1 hypothetical protein CJP74_00215 [Psittacicella melopsittaci]